MSLSKLIFKNTLKARKGDTWISIASIGVDVRASYHFQGHKLRLEFVEAVNVTGKFGAASLVGQTHFYEVESILVEGESEGPVDYCLKDLNGECVTWFRYDSNEGQSGVQSTKKIKTAKIRSQMPGKIVKVLVKKGDLVEKGDALCTMEAMKMENEIRSPIKGQVTDMKIKAGDSVDTGAELIKIDPVV